MATEEKVAQLREVTGIGLEAARQLLQATDGNVEEAVSLHFGGGDDGPWNQDMTSASSSGSASGAASSGRPGSGAGFLGNAGVSVPAASRVPQGERLFTGQETPGLTPLTNNAGNTAAASAEEFTEAAPQESGGWFASLGNAVTRLSQVVLGIAPEEFENWFATRYGEPSPTFCKECFGDAVQNALGQNKLLLVWFHQADDEATESLCKNIFQNPMVIDSVARNCLCWAGDVNRFEPGQIARLMGATIFPSVVVLQPLRHGFDHTFCLEWPLGTFAQPLFRLSPTVPGEALNVDQAVTALLTSAQDHSNAINSREEERLQRDTNLAEDRRIREEQERELEESMAIDAAKAMSEKEAQETASRGDQAAAPNASSASSQPQQSPSAVSSSSPAGATPEAAASSSSAAEAASNGAVAAEAEAAEVKRLARGAEISARPEPEPAGNAKILLKLPDGSRLQRVFRVEQRLEEVYDWAHCCRPAPKPLSFELRTNYPAKAFTDRSATVGDSGLAPSAAIFMKAVDD